MKRLFRTQAKRLLKTSKQQYSTSFHKYKFLEELGLSENNPGAFYGEKWHKGKGGDLESINPSTGEVIAKVSAASVDQYQEAMKHVVEAQKIWQNVPAPKRGEIVRQIGDELRKKREPLGKLVSLEVGKIVAEGVGEVQEYVDICDYATGLSRMYAGKVVQSERPDHVLIETCNPIGPVGVISAFNFPVAVYGWNASLALIAGDSVIWKGSHTTPLSTVAVGNIMGDVLKKNNLPASICTTFAAGADVGEAMAKDERIPLISFTGSTRVGKAVRENVDARFGKTILELGGNNAITVMNDANLEIAIRGVLFGAVGTSGQRCTTCRRLLVHEDVYSVFLERLVKAYKQIKIGDPVVEDHVLCGPLHTKHAVQLYKNAIEAAKKQGGRILYGGKVLEGRQGNFVEPTIIEFDTDYAAPITREETFVPILYVFKIKSFEQAVQVNNSVHHGLSSSIFTQNPSNIFKWIGPNGSDCGLVNVNMGTSGAEISLGFGGEKWSGVGRESGSDAWKQYCRISSCAVNYGSKLPLAQGIVFE